MFKKILFPLVALFMLAGCAKPPTTIEVSPTITLPQQDPSLMGVTVSINGADQRTDQALAKVTRDNQIVTLTASRDLRFLLQEVLEKQMTARGYMVGPNGPVNLQIIVSQLYADVSQGNVRYNIATKADIAIIATAQNGNKMTKNYRASYNVEGAFQASNKNIADAVNSVLTDTMLRGRRLSAAELGQTSIHYQGKTGPFGSRGAIEEYIGNNELAAEAVKRYAGAGIIKTVDECTPRHLDEAARSGCPIALQLWEDTAEMLGCLIMNLMYTLVPDAFIIGGGVAKAGDLLMKPLLENLRKQLFPLLMEDLKILPARFGAEAGLLGAGAMAMDEFMGLGILERFKNQKSTQTFC